MCVFFFFQAEDGIRDIGVTGVQTCALPISRVAGAAAAGRRAGAGARPRGHARGAHPAAGARGDRLGVAPLRSGRCPPPGAAGRGERRRPAGAGGGRGLRRPAAPAADGPGHRRLDGGRGGAAGLRLPGHGQLRRLPPEEPGRLVAGRPPDRRRRDDGIARTLARTAAARGPAARHRRQPPAQARPPQRPDELPPDLRMAASTSTGSAPELIDTDPRGDDAGRPSRRLVALPVALPAVLLLFALVVAVTQAWRWWHEVPTFHMDGAFQTASGLYRLADGQWPGRGFFPYLGIAPVPVLYPGFALPGGAPPATRFPPP